MYSREFGQRKVSARLPAPPHSLERRENPAIVLEKPLKIAAILRLSPQNRTGEWAKFALASGGEAKVTGFTTVIAFSGTIGQSTGSKSN
jgi:hypothetical protein